MISSVIVNYNTRFDPASRSRRINMKSLRFLLFTTLITLSMIALSTPALSTVALAQSTAPSDAQKSFDKLKALAGAWHASVTTDPPVKAMGDGAITDVSLRVTSRGNAL